jgi:uncharacterized repeat protein (TIGR01451 family)
VIQARRRQILTLAAILGLALCGGVIATQIAAQKQADGLVKVEMGDVFERGETKIEELDLAKLPALPPGFVPLNGKAYRVTTTAVVSGPYDAVFKVNSVTDEQAFKKLRVLHFEPDEFDPESYVWMDRTAESGHPAPAHDFHQRTVIGHSEELNAGVFMVVNLVPTIHANADLEVTAKASPESVQMPANVTFSITVKNNGPDGATNVGAKMDQSRVGGYFVSATPTQGTCKGLRSGVYCKLGPLDAGASATITLVLEPEPAFAGTYESSVRAGGREKDSNLENNETTGTVLTIKDPNESPVVGLEYSPSQRFFERGETIHLKATASDPDGSIKKVEFFDNHSERSLGGGASTDAKHFTLSVNDLKNGEHSLIAVATDNRGRETASGAQHIFVNGPIKVKILEPEAESVIAPGSDLTLVAEVIHPDGSIKSVEFFTAGIELGEATPGANNRFTLKLHDMKRARYPIEVIAKDESGLVSKSTLDLRVSDPPTVRIATPADGSTLEGSANIELILNRESAEYGRRVEIYSNGVLIEEGSVILSGKYAFTWRDPRPGKYTLKAVVIDVVGVRGKSSPVNIIIKTHK